MSNPSELLMGELGPGDYFGDLPMLFSQYHLASVRAKTYVEVQETCFHNLILF